MPFNINALADSLKTRLESLCGCINPPPEFGGTVEMILENIPVGVGLFRQRADGDLITVYQNAAAIADTGDMVGQPLYETLPHHKDPLPELDGRSLRDIYAEVLETAQPQHLQFHFDGEGVTGWFDTRACRPRPRLLLCVWQNVTELVEAKLRDPLTGFYNRAFLDGQGGQHVSHLAFLDMDGFKRVNDTLGHHTGDELLRSIAQRLRAGIQTHHSIIRMGGDEFAILFRNETQSGVTTISSEIVHEIGQPYQLGPHVVRLSTACGLASFERNLSQSLRNADLAMYESKRRGRLDGHSTPGIPVWYEQSMGAQFEADSDLLEVLREAIAHNLLTLEYQPIVSLEKAQDPTGPEDFPIVGYEALARLKHPVTGEAISPAEFIPLAEDNGLITEMTLQVLEIAYGHCKELNALPVPYPLKISVNLSGHDINNPRLINGIEAVLGRNEIPPRLLTFEITESVLPNPEAARRVLQKIQDDLSDAGLDDWGTGGSSLELMFLLPLTSLKIDQQFVRNELPAVAPMIDMGHHKQLVVICEGVGDLKTAISLKGMGAEMGQGYYFGRPMSAHSMLKFWR